MKRTPSARNSRAALLAAAERLFAQRGIAGARTQEIAAAARVNKALLHYYFDTKEKLYQAVLENLFQQLIATARPALVRTSSPRDSLLRFVDAYFEFLKTHPNYPFLIQREVMSRSPFLRTIVERYFGPLHRRLAEVLRRGIRRHVFRPVDVPNTVITLTGITIFYFAAAPVLGHLLGTDPFRETALAARKNAVLDFVRHGLLTQPARRTLALGEA